MRKVVEASMAVATAVKLCSPAVIPSYPITPQTHIVEHLADFISNGELNSEMIHAESEHSALSAAIGAQATGVRTFTATSSQGLALMHEVLFIASGMRMPIVMAVANRALSSPINIWCDQQDSISERDSGWLQFYVESSQEAFDTVIQAYKIAEDKMILLPVMVCLDGFTLSHVSEPVEFLTEQQVNSFLPKFKPLYRLDPAKPLTFGPIAYPDSYMYFKQQQEKAMADAIAVIRKVNNDFKKSFGHGYGDGLIEGYKLNDAKKAIVAMGTVCGTARIVVDELRKRGQKVGLLKIRCFRPFPREEIRKAVENVKSLAVIDRNVSFGSGGALATELKALLPGKDVNGFVAGLGGRDITPDILKKALSSKGGWLF